MDIFNEARSGKIDYDFSSLQKIAEGGQRFVSFIKSNIDGRVYVAK
jgi:hypothetical protein